MDRIALSIPPCALSTGTRPYQSSPSSHNPPYHLIGVTPGIAGVVPECPVNVSVSVYQRPQNIRPCFDGCFRLEQVRHSRCPSGIGGQFV